MYFADTAAELRQQEIARLTDAVVPRLDQLRGMTPDPFRAVIVGMLERFGHVIVTAAPELVTTKAGRKFVTECAAPTDLMPAGARELRRLHDAVITANAERGFFITARSFTEQAEL